MELGFDICLAVLFVILVAMIVRLIVRIDTAERRITDLEDKLNEISSLLPRDNKGEIERRELLLKQLNDEMEHSLRLEQDWNKGLQGILSYGSPIAKEGKA